MTFVAYKRDFEVNKNFNFTKFIQALDKEDFDPFILNIEKLTEFRYKLSFQRTKTPLFVTPARKGNLGDEIFLTECTIQFLESVGKIRFTASMRNSTIIVTGLFVILFLVFPMIAHVILAWIPVLVLIAFQSLKYHWDLKRYHHIAEIAVNFNSPNGK